MCTTLQALLLNKEKVNETPEETSSASTTRWIPEDPWGDALSRQTLPRGWYARFNSKKKNPKVPTSNSLRYNGILAYPPFYVKYPPRTHQRRGRP